MYKVLDVREIVTIQGGSTSNGVYGGSGSYSVNSTQYTVVIAEDEEHKRKRFEFKAGYTSKFLGKTSYYGYSGDYELLVPGDHFEIEETATYPNVRRINYAM